MKKFSTFAAAAALAVASAAPVLAETKVDSDPFASSQALGAGAAVGIAAGAAVILVVGASSDT